MNPYGCKGSAFRPTLQARMLYIAGVEHVTIVNRLTVRRLLGGLRRVAFRPAVGRILRPGMPCFGL